MKKVVDAAPGWGRYPSDLIQDRTQIVPHEDWRWHTQREVLTALLEELRGLRYQLLMRCTDEFTWEWEKENGNAWRKEEGTFPMTTERLDEILPTKKGLERERLGLKRPGSRPRT